MEDTNIDWKSLSKTKTEYVRVPISKKLPDGQYICQRCEGEGRVVTAHRTFPPHLHGICGMCGGKGVIKKCDNDACNLSVLVHETVCQECAIQKALAIAKAKK